MNERIEKLAVQARAETYAHFDDETFDWDVWHTVFQHKFAELIVGQMLAITDAHTEVFQTDRDKAVIEHIKQSVKTHFGVEE